MGVLSDLEQLMKLEEIVHSEEESREMAALLRVKKELNRQIRQKRIDYSFITVGFSLITEKKGWVATTINVSHGGLLASFDERPSFTMFDDNGVNAMVEFSLHSPLLEPKMVGLAHVVHLAEKDGQFVIGFQLVDFFDETAEVWKDFVNGLLRERNLQEME